jgi:hypothetical protein
MTSKNNDGYTVEQAYEDLQRGIELGIDDLTKKLNSSIKELSKSELERGLKAIINYPDGIKVYSKKEENFVKDLVALHGLHLQGEIQVLAELQQQNKETENGEETENSTIG